LPFLSNWHRIGGLPTVDVAVARLESDRAQAA
jgi:hypothetical protein